MSLKQAAIDVLAIIEQGAYPGPSGPVDFSAARDAAVAGTRLYTPEDVDVLRSVAASGTPTVEVWATTTQRAARVLASDESVLLLNFASARNPGGGFLNGAKAQEEDLCRCSALYPTLLREMSYYLANRATDSTLYTDHAIVSPGVPFFKVRGTGPFLEAPFVATVLTAPAPNSGPFLRRFPHRTADLEATFRRRWEMVFALARDTGTTTLLLGAWGCGAFGGDPTMAASTARAVLESGVDARRVVFAIPRMGKRSTLNLEAFARVLDVPIRDLDPAGR